MRNSLITLFLLTLLHATPCANAQPTAEANTDTPAHPHTLFVSIDDLRPELGCYGADHIISPNIDRLARSGRLFTYAYTQMAICMPARASLMSGLRPMTGRMYNRGPMLEILAEHAPDAVSLNQHFMDHGYETVNIGKIYHHASDEAEGWTRNFRSIDGPWFRRGYREPASIEMERNSDVTGNRGPAFESADVPDSGYQTGAFADKAIEEIRGITDAPLFLALGFRKPHLPFNAPQKYWDLYDPADIDLSAFPAPPENAAEEGFTNWGELRNYGGIPDEGPLDEATARSLIRGYYACVTYVDAQLGRVLDEIDAQGLADDFVVVLWSDHGWKLGDYGMWCKHTAYEIDTRVPLIIRAPAATANPGAPTDAPVELLDLYPTLCELAGLPAPAHLHGKTLTPLLANEDHPWHHPAFSVWTGRTSDRPTSTIGYTMRYRGHRYTEWRRIQGGDLVSRELYDQTAGPLVRENIVENPENATFVGVLSEILHEGHQEVWTLGE